MTLSAASDAIIVLSTMQATEGKMDPHIIALIQGIVVLL